MRGKDGAGTLIEHVRQELLHGGDRRREDEARVVLGGRDGEPGGRSEGHTARRGREVHDVGIPARFANAPGELGEALEVGQVADDSFGTDTVRSEPGDVIGERFRAARDKNDAVPGRAEALGDREPEARARA